MSYPADYWTRDIPEHWFGDLLRPDQLAALCYTLGWPFWDPAEADPRDPGLIVSMGCGRGVLEQALESLGHSVIGVDPWIPAGRYRGSRLAYEYPDVEAGTVIYCESLEHIAEPVFPDCRIVVTNWVSHHPIQADGSGWDHIRTIDDAYYDEITRNRRVVLRRGSHLVFE